MSSRKIRIRRVRILRTDDIAPLILPNDPWKTMQLTRKDVRAMAKAMTTDRYVVGAFDGKKLVGFASLVMGMLGGGYLNLLAVDGEYQGHGIGKMLIKESERVVFKKYKNYYLCVSSFNKRAIAFYKKLGFEKTGTIKELIIAGHDELFLRKTTGPIRKLRK